jgi:hypothetical protein
LPCKANGDVQFLEPAGYCSAGRASACKHLYWSLVRTPVTNLRFSPQQQSISGLVVEYIVAIDVTRVRFPADALDNAIMDQDSLVFSPRRSDAKAKTTAVGLEPAHVGKFKAQSHRLVLRFLGPQFRNRDSNPGCSGAFAFQRRLFL